MWVHFESMHVDMTPTYASMYFPGRGLLLAAGNVLTGNSWLVSAVCRRAEAIRCSTGRLSPFRALLGGLIAVPRLGVFVYWTKSNRTAGTRGAFGGALVFGHAKVKEAFVSTLCAAGGCRGRMAADINAARVIWVREMDERANAELLRYNPNLQAWPVQPDSPADEVAPYLVPRQVTAGSAR